MTLIRTCRALSRTGRPKFVPGGMACAVSARRASFVPTAFPLSSTLKRVSGAMASPLRLMPVSG